MVYAVAEGFTKGLDGAREGGRKSEGEIMKEGGGRRKVEKEGGR